MTELTKRCLNLSNTAKRQLIKELELSMEQEVEDDGSRFITLYREATDMCGKGILTKNRDRMLVIGRSLIAYKMREEGYTYESIGRHLRRHHASVIHVVRLLQDALDFDFPEARIWREFNERINEHDKNRKIQPNRRADRQAV